jgi:hypothetical protein
MAELSVAKSAAIRLRHLSVEHKRDGRARQTVADDLAVARRDRIGRAGEQHGRQVRGDRCLPLRRSGKRWRRVLHAGIVVIEPAGNGFGGVGHDLDLQLRSDGTSLDRTTPMFFDSGAILVGARHALISRSRMPFSCFGNRVDCHCWGEGIVTTSSVSGPFGPYMGLNPAGGDAGFGGTSGASAIIAGAAIVLQGIARDQGTPLNPSAMRALLSGTFNTTSDNPAVDRIGVMPNLKGAIDHI